MTEAADQLEVRPYRAEDEGDVLGLWQASDLLRPWNNPYRDIERKCQDSPELFFVGEHEGRVIASCMAGYDGHRGWLYYLAVLPAYRGRGFARSIIHHAEQCLRALGCPKLELMVRHSNTEVLSFYQGQDYQLEEVAVLSKRLVSDEAYELTFDPAASD